MRKFKKWTCALLAAVLLLPQTAMPQVKAQEPILALQDTEAGLLKAGSVSASKSTETQGQPFAKGTAGSNLFRIPCLITLENGDILAAADARYTEYRDFGGIDTIASVSSDGGKTWQYSFPIYFPDSNGSAAEGQATTAIDPILVQGDDGTIYCMADMNPTGVTTLDVFPGAGTGYITVNGVERLALTSSWGNSASEPKANPDKYEYYVGDFTNGYAPVLKVADNTATQYAVDEWYNIYSVKDGEYVADLTQTQVNSDTVIQQNAFYKDSVLHVYKTGYIWMVTSKDNGRTWSNPTILNPQVKREDGKETALLVSPGKGLLASDGTIYVGMYNTLNGERASFISSTDGGKNWTRSEDIAVPNNKSSENEMVELPDGTIRMFYRSTTNYICYSDITKNSDGTYNIGTRQQITDFQVSSNCNVSAVLLEDETIDGKPVVLISLPSTPGDWNRNDGRIYVFTVNNDKTMKHEYTFEVNNGEFAYSCMSITKDGNVGLLWEPGNNERSAIRYDEFEMKYVLGEEILRDVVVEAGKTYTDTYVGKEAMALTTKPNEDVATVAVETAEEVSVPLYNHNGSKNGNEPIKSFAANANTALLLKNAEFEFIKTDNEGIYTIKNKESGQYLVNNAAQNMCEANAVNMKVEKVTDEETGAVSFRISNSGKNRYIMFYLTQMNFNCHGGNGTTNTANTDYNLVLFEKKAKVEAGDLVPGYQRVTEIEEGKSYVIAAIYEGRAILYYPEGGSTYSQTKLVGRSEDVEKVATNTVRITGVGNGTTTAVVDHVTYNITVKTPVIVSDTITATAGSQHATTGNNSASAAVDKDTTTVWHSNWSNDTANRDKHWITIDLGKEYKVDGLRYLSRSGSINGIITGYEISYSVDGETFKDATSGEWAGAQGTWYEAEFSPVVARYIKLKSVDASSDSGGKFASAAEIEIRGVEAADVEEPEVPEEPYKLPEYGIFDMGDYGVFNYRIPALVTTKNGVVIAAADERNDHWSDWGNIDTVIRRSEDNGLTWSEPQNIIDLKSQPYDTGTQSAFLIDPVMIATESGRVWMLVDMFPESTGFSSIQETGTGYVKVDGKDYLALYDADGNEYTLRGTEVYDAAGNKTSYTVAEGTAENAFHEKGDLYDNGEYVGNIFLSSQNKGNISAPLKPLKTIYLWLTYSDDDGKTWSNPVDITPQVKAEWMKFCGTGPGFGLELKAEEKEGRLIFPIYYTNAAGFQSSASIYSDDNGVTWTRAESPNDGRINNNGVATDSQNPTGISQLTESQIIEISNGHLFQFMRNTGGNGKVAVSRSTDGGTTWSDPVDTNATEVYCQLSVLYLDNKGTDGRDRVLMSNPGGSGRNNGTLRIGEIVETADSFSIQWVEEKMFCPGNYAYSCLTRMADGNFGLLYEHANTIKFTAFNEAFVKSEENALSPTILSVTYNVEKETEHKYTIAGDTYVFTVTLDQAVTVTGEPQFRFTLDGEMKYADYASIDATGKVLTFEYVVQNGDEGFISYRGPKIVLDAQNAVKNAAGCPVSSGDLEVSLGYIGVDPADADRDIPLDQLQATAGDSQSGEGPDKAVDGNGNSHWHTNWAGLNSQNHWFQFEVVGDYEVDGLRYQPRQTGGKNGVITAYEVQISSDGKTFETIASGEWAADTNWKLVTFDAVQTKYVRLVSKDAVSGETGKAFASAAEIRLTGTEAEVEVCQHTETTVVGKVDATCTAEGYTGDTVCAECGHVVTKGTAIGKLAHTEVVVAGKEATCTETGLTEGTKCSVCNTVIVAQEVIPAKGHTFGDWTVVTAPTTEAEGLEKRVCACGEEETRVITKLPAVPEVVDKTAAQKYFDECEVYYVEADYTEESWAAYELAMAALEEALAEEDVTADELQAAVDAVEAATEALVKAEVPVDPENPDDTDKPADPEKQETDDKEEDKSPVTGDTAIVLPMIVLMAACAAIVAILRKRLVK